MGRPYLFLLERIDRAWQNSLSAYQARGRRARWVARVASLTVIGFALTQLVPTLADESTPPPNQVIVSQSIEETSTVVVVGSDENLSGSGGDNSPTEVMAETSIAYATTETETVIEPVAPPVEVAGEQGMQIRVPNSVKVDPRSVTALLPEIQVGGTENLLICLQGSGIRFDSGSKGFGDDIDGDEFKIEGDLTGSLRVSGSRGVVMGFLNSAGGLRVWSNGGAIAGKSWSISAVALTGVSVDEGFCDSGSVRFMEVRALGLNLNTKKGGVRLN